jgi:hypothetical protein
MKYEGHKLLRQKGLTILRDILPKEKIAEVTKELYPQVRERCLTTALQFGLLAFAQIQKAISSLDELLYAGLGKIGKIYQIKGVLVTKQSFSQRSKVLPWQIFKRLFEYLLESAAQMGVSREKVYQGLYTIKLLDATILDVAARLIGTLASQPGRRFKAERSKKGKVKLKMILNQTCGLPELIRLDQGRASELKGIKRLVKEALKRAAAVILVMDLGYFCYDFLGWLIDQGTYFVSRIKQNTRYEVIKKLGRHEWLVKLGVVAAGQKQVVVRLVRVKEKKRWYYYITNLMDREKITRKEIRELYRYRWQIEILFKELKEVLNFKKIFFYNVNGIKGQIYVALSVYVISKILIMQSAQRHGVSEKDFSFKRVVQATRGWLNQNPEKIFCSKPHRAVVNELLDKIFEFAYRKKPSLDREKDSGCLVKKGKDVA